MKIFLVLIAIVLWIQPGYSHSLWAIQEGSSFILVRGTPPDEREAYAPEAVREVQGFDSDGKEIPLHRRNEEGRVVVEAEKNPAVITARCDWGFRVLTTEGKRLISKKEAEEQGLQVVESFFSTQFLKAFFVDTPHPRFDVPVGLPLEIIPLNNPWQAQSGSPLSIQVLFEGKPLAEASVAYKGAPRGGVKTDAEGKVTLPADATLRSVFVRHRVEAEQDADIDFHQLMSFITF
jgi:nickel transport protein